jgi:hypothetical protein
LHEVVKPPESIFLYSALKVCGQIRKTEKARNFAVEMAIPKLGLRFAGVLRLRLPHILY